MRAPLEALLDSGPLLGDGGTGTSLVERGVPLGASFDVGGERCCATRLPGRRDPLSIAWGVENQPRRRGHLPAR